MNFRKFSSMEHSDNQEFLNDIIKDGLANEKFVVQEKAHGGNLSIWTDDGVNFKTAKRTAFLEEDEKFYNHQLILEDLKPKLVQLWHKINEDAKISQMTLYGEILGGIYPHKDIKKAKGAIQVQKGVYYTPNNEFYAFDLLLNNENFVNHNKLNELLEEIGFLYAKNLFIGSLEDALKYPNDFQSLIHKDLNLPTIEDNICEGVVIRTIENLRLKSGRRILLKNKNDKWKEKEKSMKGKRKKKVIPEYVKELQIEIGLYVTQNRLNNVISKIGEVTKMDFGKLMKLFTEDIIEEFSKDNKDDLKNIDEKEIKQITKSINKKMVDLVKAELGIKASS